MIDVYESYGKNSFQRSSNPFTGLPGIYVITPCTNANQTACVADSHISVKVGMGIDLANRLDTYHTYFPYGFTILRLYVLERVVRTDTERSHDVFKEDQITESDLVNMLETAETHILRYLHYALPFNKLVITRPARSEWFRFDATPKQLEANLKKLDSFVSALKLLSPAMPRIKTSPVYGTLFKKCCAPPRFSVYLGTMTKQEELRRFRNIPNPLKTATLVQKTEFIRTISSAARETVAVIGDNIVDIDGNVLVESTDARAEEAHDPKRLKFDLAAGFIHTFFGAALVH